MTDRYLPKWAQEEMKSDKAMIRSLQQEVEQLRSTLAGDGGGMFGIHRMGHSHKLMLDSDIRSMRVKFPGMNGFEFDVQPDSDGNGSIGEKGWTQVMVTSHHGLGIYPQSGNVVHLGPRLI